jgi:hypothetical protein
MVGPKMVAAWKNVEPHATAFGKCSSGTSSGRNAWLAGPLNARSTPISVSTA